MADATKIHKQDPVTSTAVSDAPAAREYAGADFRRTLAQGTLTEQVLLSIFFAVMVVANILSTASDVFNGQTNKMISDSNPTFITPDGSTFAIWGFIYAGEAALVVYQALPRHKNHPLLIPARRWIMAAFLLNTAWLPIFAYFRWWLGLVVIAGYLYALYRTYVHMQVDYGSDQSWQFKACCMAGISFNFAWVLVATLLNFTVVARNSGIVETFFTAPQGQPFAANTSGIVITPGGGGSGDNTSVLVGGNVDWAVLCISAAASIALYRALRYNDVPYCFTTAWALGGIYRMQTQPENTRFPTVALSSDVANWALVWLVFVGIAGAVSIIAAHWRTKKHRSNLSMAITQGRTGQV